MTRLDGIFSPYFVASAINFGEKNMELKAPNTDSASCKRKNISTDIPSFDLLKRLPSAKEKYIFDIAVNGDNNINRA